MKNELIKLAKVLNLSGYNSYSSRILKVADEFDEVTMETNYDKVYEQINTFIQDLKSEKELATFAKTPLTTIGLQHIAGSLDESSVVIDSNVEKITVPGNYDDIPEIISIDYYVKLRPMVVSDPLYSKVKEALLADGSKDKIKDSFNEGIESSYEKHRMKAVLPEEVEVLEREDLYNGDDSPNPLRQRRVVLDPKEQTIEARFQYTTKVSFKQKMQSQYGSNPRAKDDTVSNIVIHYNISIPDPKKDTARRNELNAKHQEKMKEDKRKAEMAKVVSAAVKEHRKFIRHLSDLKSECVNYINPEPDPGATTPLGATESYKSKCCMVIGNQIAKFMNIYGIKNLDNPSDDEIEVSMERNKKYNQRASEPPVALLYKNENYIPPAYQSFENALRLLASPSR